MEKDVSKRLRRAVKENNLFLVKRFCKRADLDIRNPDPGPGRYTSLAWAAVKGYEEIFDLLLMSRHDDGELSKDTENNTILILLAEIKLDQSSSKYSREAAAEQRDKAIRMARQYFERYPFTLDWSNYSGKTALHVASLKGNEEFIKTLLDMGADIDLPDMQGNTPLHYASAWGHLSVVQLLIERGCRYAARNNEGFLARDYAYSTTTMDSLEDSARQQVEKNKLARQSARKNARQAARAEQGNSGTIMRQSSMNSFSSTDDLIGDTANFISNSPSLAADSSMQTAERRLANHGFKEADSIGEGSKSFEVVTSTVGLPDGQSALTPIASRVREKDADAIAQFMDSFRSTRVGHKSAIVDPGRPVNPLTKHVPGHVAATGFIGARAAIHKLKQSVSLNQIRGMTPMASQTNPLGYHIETQDNESEFAITPKATTIQSTLSASSRDSITPPANRRSPFNALLSRNTSHQI